MCCFVVEKTFDNLCETHFGESYENLSLLFGVGGEVSGELPNWKEKRPPKDLPRTKLLRPKLPRRVCCVDHYFGGTSRPGPALCKQFAKTEGRKAHPTLLTVRACALRFTLATTSSKVVSWLQPHSLISQTREKI